MSSQKIIKPKGEQPTEFELQIASILMDLQVNTDLKVTLRELYITGAKEIEISPTKKAIVLQVPVPQLRNYQKVHTRLVRELEKKFSGRYVVLLANRRILAKPTRKSKYNEKQKRPRSRTLTSVHDQMLHDLVYPAEIVGKRTQVAIDGKRLIRCHLDKSQQTNIEHKIETFSSLYKKLTGKEVAFEFPEWVL